ncbi:hypothetical protein PENSPDRAFT_638874 [Peniophora sp. CONT]|nr:hypothetical protein PENSPDRAFT_638874 [Peniophora sp. CONT]
MPSGVNGTACSAEDYALSQDSDFPNVYCLTRGDSVGLSFGIQAGMISIIAVVILFGLIIRNILRHRKYAPRGSWTLLREPTDIYMLSLFTLDIIQALGKVTSIRWVYLGRTFSGEYCTAQGALQQFGETGVACTTLVITIHTFMSVFWRRGLHSRTAASIVVGLIYLFVALWVGLGIGLHKDEEFPFYNPTPYWCWISSRYANERIGGEYLWLWLALIISIILYVPLFFWSQGNLSVDPERWWRFRIHPRPAVLEFSGRRRRAFSILAYPAIYSILICPVSVIRWVGFGLEAQGQPSNIPSVATFIVDYTYTLSGVFNVSLLLLTRPNLLLFGPIPRGDDEAPMLPEPKNVSSDTQSSGTVGRLHDEDEGSGWDIPNPETHSAITRTNTAATNTATTSAHPTN